MRRRKNTRGRDKDVISGHGWAGIGALEGNPWKARSCPLWVLCHEHAGPNGMCNCTRDGGGPFEVGNQVLVSSHRKLLWSKAMVVSVAENRNEIPAGEIERGERKQTVGEVSKAD